MHHYL